MEERRSYVYRHRRLDSNEIFYVGKGTIYNKNKNSLYRETLYKRAFNKTSRHKKWKEVVSCTSYSVEILATNLNEVDAYELEIFLISHYKRADCCGGTLVNLTNGGDGVLGIHVTDERRKELSDNIKGDKNYFFQSKRFGHLNPFFGKTHSEKSLENMRGNGKSRECSKNVKAKKVLNMKNGVMYDCVKQASVKEGINYSNLRAYLNGAVSNKTSMIQLEKGEFEIYLKYFSPKTK